MFKELCRGVGDDGVGGDEVEQQHHLHSDLLPAPGHGQHDVVSNLLTQGEVATRGHGEINAEQDCDGDLSILYFDVIIYDQNSLPMARVAEIGNLLLCFMSAWIVGKVEAPAKANMMDPNAELCFILDHLFKYGNMNL